MYLVITKVGAVDGVISRITSRTDAPCVLSKNGNTVVLTLAVTKTFPKHFGLHTLLMSH